MYWENPSILLTLWILPLLAWLLVSAHRKRLSAARTFVEPAMVARIVPALGGPRPWIKGILLLAGIGLLIVAAARPRFGVYTETVAQRGVDLFVLLDVSRSMTAEDVAPNRLERAKSDVCDLLPHLAGDRVGLIVFAGKPVVKAPLTSDHGFFRTVLDEVDVGTAPRGGTLIGDAIRKALEAMPRSRDRDQALVLITDGEDQDSYAEDAAKEAAERGVKIFTVGLGDSREGARIPVRDDSGRLTYLQYEGQERWSKRNDDLLGQIALTTGGAYVPAGTRAYDLGQIYSDHLANLTRGEYQAEKRKRYQEQFQWFAAMGLLLVLLETGIRGSSCQQTKAPPVPGEHRAGEGDTKRRRKSVMNAESPFGGHGAAGGPGKAAENALAGRPLRPVALVILLSVSSVAWAGSGAATTKVRDGIASYRAGDYKQAAAAFGEAVLARPDDLRIAFDRGTALAAAGDEKAIEPLEKAALAPDLSLAVRARYNLGCLAVAKARKRFGEHPEKASPEDRKRGLADLAVAIGHFRDCIRMDKDYADARHNLELLRLWIKYMESVWEQTDRQQQRDELDLPTYLEMLEESQRAIRLAARSLAGTRASARLREAQRAAEKLERQLGEEIGPLKQKIEAALTRAAQPSAAGAAAPPISADDVKKAIARLQSMADEAGMAIDAAAAKLHAGKASEAVAPQTDVVEKFSQMYRSVAPYPSLVRRAIATQQALVDQAASPSARGDEGGKTPPHRRPGGSSCGSLAAAAPAAGKKDGSRGNESNNAGGTRPSRPVPLAVEAAAEAQWNQGFVTRYSEILAPLAEATLKRLESAPRVAANKPASQPGSSVSTDTEELQRQREGLRRSLEKAVKLGPKVEKLSDEAARSLQQRNAAEASPKQQEALKLLEEIAEPLPKEDKKQDQQGQNQGQHDQKQQHKKPSDK
jgi:Ca-activated chloride channel family protein